MQNVKGRSFDFARIFCPNIEIESPVWSLNCFNWTGRRYYCAQVGEPLFIYRQVRKFADEAPFNSKNLFLQLIFSHRIYGPDSHYG